MVVVVVLMVILMVLLLELRLARLSQTVLLRYLQWML
jgi:hypothetical protein